MFSKRVKHYHQWLCTAIPFKAKFGQISSDSVRVQGPAKRPSLGHLYPVSKRNRKGGKCKISRVLQSPVPSTQASPKVEASDRPKQAQHFSTRRKVQNGNSRVHQDLPDSWGVGIIDRSVGRLPAHPHPPKLKEIPKVLLQGSGVPVHLSPIRTSHSPPGLYNDCKGSETNGPLKRTQNSPIPGRLADQVPVSGGSPSEHSGGGRPNPVLGVDSKSGKIRTETYSGVFVRGLRVPSRFSPCKTHSREMAQTPGFDPTPQVKTCFDCKMFDVANWVASLNGENGPGGTPSHEALSVSSQGALEISSVAGQPPSLDRSHCSPPRLVAKSLKRDERCRPSSQRPQYPTLYQRLKRRLGRSLRPKFYKGSVVRSGKKTSHKCPRIKGGLPGPSRLQGPVPEPNSVVATDNSTVVAYINKQGGTHSAEMCALLWKIMTWFHHYQITLKARHIPGCLNVMADLLSRFNQVQSTEWSLQVFKQICQMCFRPHVDLFATHLNHKLPLYVSPAPDQPHGLCLPSYGSPSQGDPKDQAMSLPDHRDSPRLARDALVLGPSAALNRDPSTTPSVNDPIQTVPQVCVPQQPITAEPPRLVSRSGQLQEQGFSGGGRENCCSSAVINKDHLQVKVGPI